ncbi:MAG: OsmC family protein [Candidatus Omnitrophota bacterium]
MDIAVKVQAAAEDKFTIECSSGAKLRVDKSKEGSIPEGPNPLELFLSSLAACVGVYAKRYLTTHAISFNELTINAHALFSQDSPNRLVNIQVRVHTDAKLDDKKEVFLRFIRGCPVHNTVIHTKEVDINIA